MAVQLQAEKTAGAEAGARWMQLDAAGSSWSTNVLWGVSDDEAGAEAEEADRDPHVKNFAGCVKRLGVL